VHCTSSRQDGLFLMDTGEIRLMLHILQIDVETAVAAYILQIGASRKIVIATYILQIDVKSRGSHD